MELLRDRAGTDDPDDTPAPRPAGRLRRLLALAAAVGALIAFTTLARPQASPSSRLSIGGEDGIEAGGDASTADAADREGAGGDPETARPGGEAQALVRPLDPSTLADVPANILAVGPEEWTWPSQGGALLALPDFSGLAREIRVVDARTFQPVVTVETDGSFTDFYGFTPGADALVVQAGGANGQTLLRYPLDPEQPVTGVDLPEGLEVTDRRPAMLADGRVAMVMRERSASESDSRSTVHVLVADLLAERMVVDLPLPGLRADFMYGPPRQDASQAIPGFAWDSARERLYIAHADAARVTVVDLAGGAVLAEAEVGVPVAELGEQPGHRWRWAEVSPDGTRLYTAGNESLAASSAVTPFGLSVIDTATLSEVGRIEGVDGVQLSPDGRWLLWSVPSMFAPGPTDDVQRVALMDTAQVGLVNLLGDRSAAYPLGFSLDSSHVYLHRAGSNVVVAYALPSLAQTGERRLPEDAWFDPSVGLLHEGG